MDKTEETKMKLSWWLCKTAKWLFPWEKYGYDYFNDIFEVTEKNDISERNIIVMLNSFFMSVRLQEKGKLESKYIVFEIPMEKIEKLNDEDLEKLSRKIVTLHWYSIFDSKMPAIRQEICDICKQCSEVKMFKEVSEHPYREAYLSSKEAEELLRLSDFKERDIKDIISGKITNEIEVMRCFNDSRVLIPLMGEKKMRYELKVVNSNGDEISWEISYKKAKALLELEGFGPSVDGMLCESNECELRELSKKNGTTTIFKSIQE